jgi:hypothetical protein
MTRSPSRLSVLAAAATLAGLASACSSAGETVKETMRTVGQGYTEGDRAIREPFKEQKPLSISRAEGSRLGPAAKPLDPAKVQAAVERYAKDKSQQTGTYVSAGSDLDGDGKPEFLVLFTSESWCQPQGCPLVVFKDTTFGYRAHSTTNRVRPPVLVSAERTGGWHDLWVTSGKDAKDKDKGKAPLIQAIRLKHGPNGYPGSASFAIDPAGAKPEGAALIEAAELKLPEKAQLVGMPGKSPPGEKPKTEAAAKK